MKKISFLLLSIIFAIVWLAVSLSALDINEAFSAETYTNGDTVLPYRIFVPENYDPAQKYPLILFLHGAGERGNDNSAQLKNAVQVLFDREDGLAETAIVIAPQCPEGEQWVDTPWADGNYSVDEIPESDELSAVCALVFDIAKKYSVDSNRIYAMGISMGGFGTWDLIMRHNDTFAAAVPICGGADPSKAELLVSTPIYTFHGTADTSVPYEGTEEMVNAIEDAGGRNIFFVPYQGAGHGIWNDACSEDGLLEWLFAQNLTDRYPDKADNKGEETVSGTETEESASESHDTSADPSSAIESTLISDTESQTQAASEKTDSNTLVIVIVIFVCAVIAVALTAIIITKKKK